MPAYFFASLSLHLPLHLSFVYFSDLMYVHKIDLPARLSVCTNAYISETIRASITNN